MGDLRSHILSEIQRLASQAGQPPGWKLFHSTTGVRETEWRGRFWSKWGDALREAGFAPNEFVARLDSREILETVAALTLELGHVPTGAELMMLRRQDPAVPSPKTVLNHFKKDALLSALRALAEKDQSYSGLLALLPEISAVEEPVGDTRREGWIYLLKSGDHFKLGRSDTLERRIKEIGVSLPQSATLEHAIRTDDPSGIEAYWHRRFAEKRAGGEWFKLSRADVAAFKRRKFQ